MSNTSGLGRVDSCLEPPITGDTALYLAMDKGHSYTVRALVDLGADVNTANLGGWTPLMMASAKEDLETMAICSKIGSKSLQRLLAVVLTIAGIKLILT
jgi:ankyrin repeat protein